MSELIRDNPSAGMQVDPESSFAFQDKLHQHKRAASALEPIEDKPKLLAEGQCLHPLIQALDLAHRGLPRPAKLARTADHAVDAASSVAGGTSGSGEATAPYVAVPSPATGPTAPEAGVVIAKAEGDSQTV